MFDWLGDIVSGLGDAIGNAFGSVSDKLIDGILNRIIQWIFTVIYADCIAFLPYLCYINEIKRSCKQRRDICGTYSQY